MKRIAFLMFACFLFASFTSNGKIDGVNIVGKWNAVDPQKWIQTVVFYEDNTIKIISTKGIEMTKRCNLDQEANPMVLSVEMDKRMSECPVGLNPTLKFAFKIIDENHILIAKEDGAVRQSSFTKCCSITLIRELD